MGSIPIYPKPASSGSGAIALIQTIVADGSGFGVSFLNIPQTYTHLELRCLTASVSGPSSLALRFNDDSGTSYLYGYTLNTNGTVTGLGGTLSSDALCGLTGEAGFFASTRISIPGYSSTTLPKSYVFDSFVATSDVAISNIQGGGTYLTGTPAITELDIYDASGEIAAGSVFSLYGLQ